MERGRRGRRLLDQLSRSIGGAGAGGLVSGGLGELLDRFKQSGQGATAESWVRTGPNQPVTPAQLEQAIGPERWKPSRRKQDCRGRMLARLSHDLPDAVDRYTPHGRLPTETASSGS